MLSAVRLGMSCLALLIGGFTTACGGASSVPSSAVTGTHAPAVSPTPDPAEAEVKAAAMRFVEALVGSAKSGDAKAVNTLVAPGSPALGNVGSTAEVTMHSGKGFMASRLAFDEPIEITVSAASASARGTYTIYGHEASWPSLTPLEPDQKRGPLRFYTEMQLVSGTWLVYAFS